MVMMSLLLLQIFSETIMPKEKGQCVGVVYKGTSYKAKKAVRYRFSGRVVLTMRDEAPAIAAAEGTALAGVERHDLALAGLVEKHKKIEADLAANKKEAGAYSLAHADEFNRYLEATRKGAKIAAGLARFADDWARFEQNDKDLKRQLAETRAAIESERRDVPKPPAAPLQPTPTPSPRPGREIELNGSDVITNSTDCGCEHGTPCFDR